jgi:L-iditol 2-dehydrogenase
VPIAEPAEGEALLRVLAIGLCGSDAHWFREGGIGDANLGDGLVLGHEFSAVIESGPRSGLRVAVDPAVPCLRCEQCTSGRTNLCLALQVAGHSTDGALRGHMVWPERCLVPLPDHLPDELGAVLEPLGVALHAIDLAGVIEGASVGVIGCGPIGLLLVAALRDRGVERIVASDPLAHRVEAAGRMGATEAIIAGGDQDEVEPLAAALDGALDVVFETAGSDPALHSALATARPGARVALIGIPDGDRTSYVASLARRKELTLSVCRRMLPGDLVRAADLAERGLPGLDRLVSHRYPMSEAGEAFQTLVDRSGLKGDRHPRTG